MQNIAYLGDTNLQGAAAYLAGLMHAWGWSFDYLPSDVPPASGQWDTNYGLIILSDYPAANLTAADHQAILDQVAKGAGLLMIGGWESFHGQGGDWDGTPIGDLLPVEISSQDDRRNCDQPVLVRRVMDHPITEDLPWEDRPPVIGGFNQVEAKPESQVILEACLFLAQRQSEEEFTFELARCLPLLVIGEYQAGRVAALMTDVAPHWVGPLVDWGQPRVAAQAAEANAIEVGGHYAQFLRQLLEWTGNFAASSPETGQEESHSFGDWMKSAEAVPRVHYYCPFCLTLHHLPTGSGPYLTCPYCRQTTPLASKAFPVMPAGAGQLRSRGRSRKSAMFLIKSLMVLFTLLWPMTILATAWVQYDELLVRANQLKFEHAGETDSLFDAESVWSGLLAEKTTFHSVVYGMEMATLFMLWFALQPNRTH